MPPNVKLPLFWVSNFISLWGAAMQVHLRDDLETMFSLGW